MHLYLRLRIGCIYHMNDISAYLASSRVLLKASTRLWGKLADKAYGIRKKKLLSVIQRQKTGSRIQCGKQLIFC